MQLGANCPHPNLLPEGEGTISPARSAGVGKGSPISLPLGETDAKRK
ncbi:MAG: hypothetical protein QOG67_2879 [Verrucomicrobiota bacterium]|jgi:hypothetical protein